MKKLLLAFAIIMGISFAANAQAPVKKGKKAKSAMELKTHTCTEACHTSGYCVFVHGEKGHTCTTDCKKMTAAAAGAEMKEHVCTEACKNAGHVYAHGEKGHACTEACKKEM